MIPLKTRFIFLEDGLHSLYLVEVILLVNVTFLGTSLFFVLPDL